MTRIVRQMLGLYRNVVQFDSFDINGVVEDTLALFARPLAKAGIVVDKRLGELPPFKGSGDQFRQLLSNLVVNSRDSMASGWQAGDSNARNPLRGWIAAVDQSQRGGYRLRDQPGNSESPCSSLL